MAQVVELFPSVVGAEHPAIAALRERLGQLTPEYETALQTIGEWLRDLDKQSLGQPLAAALFNVARDQTMSQTQLRGWVAGMFLWLMSRR